MTCRYFSAMVTSARSISSRNRYRIGTPLDPGGKACQVRRTALGRPPYPSTGERCPVQDRRSRRSAVKGTPSRGPGRRSCVPDSRCSAVCRRVRATVGDTRRRPSSFSSASSSISTWVFRSRRRGVLLHIEDHVDALVRRPSAGTCQQAEGDRNEPSAEVDWPTSPRVRCLDAETIAPRHLNVLGKGNERSER